MSALEPPSLSSRSSYARKFQDAAFWQPYIDEVMRRHNLPSGLATLGTGGTFPTFLVGTYVIKFFGQRFDGAECFQIERSTQTRVLPSLRVTVPRHVADGHLFDAGWRWPYIVTTRLAGTAWWHTSHTAGDWQHVVAAELGAALRELHELDCPDEPVWHRDVVAALRASCTARHRRRRTLPGFLIEQIEDYLAPASNERRLVHADLHGDHVFVHDGHLAGIIDWGDALCGDPYYELPALFFGTFGGSKALLRTFLDAYGWPVGADFAHRAMSTSLARVQSTGRCLTTVRGDNNIARPRRNSLATVMSSAFRAVLFDWRGTLFHDEDEADWIRASAASIGRSMTSSDMIALVEGLGPAAEHPEVVAAHQTADCSADLHRAAVLLELRLAGFDDQLAQACHDRDGHLGASMPYPDTTAVLKRLKVCGMRIGIVSDIHYQLAPHFDHYDLGQFVDSYTLSFEHGVQKPDPQLFQIALDQLGVTAAETLMVGDRANRDGGAAAVGITTLILPPVKNYTARGLDVVLHLLQCS